MNKKMITNKFDFILYKTIAWFAIFGILIVMLIIINNNNNMFTQEDCINFCKNITTNNNTCFHFTQKTVTCQYNPILAVTKVYYWSNKSEIKPILKIK